jgi:hypothetical protein
VLFYASLEAAVVAEDMLVEAVQVDLEIPMPLKLRAAAVLQKLL